jgi:hypothetical protein
MITADGSGNFAAAITLAAGTHILTATQTANGVTSAASAPVTLTVQVLPPVISKAFGAASIVANESTTLTFTISNPNTGTVLTGVGFTDYFPVTLVVGAGATLSTTCAGGSITGVPGGSTVSLSGATLAANSSCSLVVSAVTSNALAAITLTNTAIVTSSQGTGNAASATLQVVAPTPPPIVQITDNETITVTDTASFPDVFDAETVHVADAIFVTPLIQVTAPVADFSAGAVGFTGQSGSQTITVSDIGLASLTLTSATISGSSQFTITQVVCSNSTTSLSTVLQSGGACTLTLGYTPSATPASDNGMLTFADNAALSNVLSTPAGSSYTQSVPLSGSGPTTPPPPPPPAVISVPVNETIQVTDSFPDVLDSEQITVADQVSIQLLNATTTSISITGGIVYGTPVNATVTVSSSTAAVTGNVTLALDGGSPTTVPLSNGSATFNLGSLAVAPHAVVANFPAQGNFLGSSAATKFVVTQATPVISWKNPAPITYGTPLGNAQLNAIASFGGTLLSGAFVYNPPLNTVLGAGTQTLSATFTPADAIDYTIATATVTLQVNQATPTITWANPAPITYGTPLSSTQLNATASFAGTSLQGTFVYNPPLKTVLNAGTQTLSLTFTPIDARDYQTVTQTVSITVNVNGNLSIQPGQTYTFTNGSISGSVTLAGGTLTLSGSTIGNNLTMSSGSLTLGGNSTIGGNVQIQGGSFSIGPATIKGNLQITNVLTGSAPGVVCGASVNGDLVFQSNGIPGQIGPASCSGNTIAGNLQITGNTAPMQIYKNAVGGNLQVLNNTRSAQVFQNTVQNLLQCSGNSAPFTGARNTAASKQGQCASF